MILFSVLIVRVRLWKNEVKPNKNDDNKKEMRDREVGTVRVFNIRCALNVCLFVNGNTKYVGESMSVYVCVCAVNERENEEDRERERWIRCIFRIYIPLSAHKAFLVRW